MEQSSPLAIMQAELIGIKVATKLAIREGRRRRVHIYSDSSRVHDHGVKSDSGTPQHVEKSRSNEIEDDFTRLGTRQPLMCLESAEGILYTQMKEHFRIWEEKNNNS